MPFLWRSPLSSNLYLSHTPLHFSGEKRTGGRFLVLAHRLGTDQLVWSRILPYFRPHYNIILSKLVCADSVNSDYFDFNRYNSLHAYVDDLLQILDTLHVDRCFFVGHSLSSTIGILAATRRLDLFAKLILIGASPRFVNDKDYHGGFEAGEVEKVFLAMESIYEAWVNGFAPLAVEADVPAAVREFSRTLFNVRPKSDVSAVVGGDILEGASRRETYLKVSCCKIQNDCFALMCNAHDRT